MKRESTTMPESASLIKATCACALALALACFAGCANSETNPSADQSTAPSTEASSEAQPGASAASDEPPASDDFTVIEDYPNQASSTGASDTASTDEWASSPLAERLLPEMRAIAADSGMTVNACAIDLASGERAGVGADKRMVSASMIKLAIAACVLQQAEDGALSLDDAYALKESDIVGGTGSLGGRGAGAETTFGEMLRLMISESDNTATNALIDTVGMDAVNNAAHDLGLKKTQLNRLMMDEDAIAKGTENYTSAADVTRILQLAYEGKLVSEKASTTLLEALAAQTDDQGLKAGLPEDAHFAHKTGSLANVQHDGGIVTFNAQDDSEDARDPFIIVALCGGDGFSQDGAFSAMEKLASACVEETGGSTRVS